MELMCDIPPEGIIALDRAIAAKDSGEMRAAQNIEPTAARASMMYNIELELSQLRSMW